MEKHCVHRLKFYNLDPSSINNLAYNRYTKQVAVLRSNNRIEIWDVRGRPFIQSTIPLNPKVSLRSLLWCKNVLFGADLQGFVKQYDLSTLQEKKSYVVTSGPCHSIAANKEETLFAAGTEKGYINVFTVTVNGLQPDKLIGNLKRILCMCWDASSKFIIAALVKNIKVFNYEDGQCVRFIKLPKASKTNSAVVWSIAVDKEFNIFAGDSRGMLTIWDGNNGSLVASYQTHKADILTVCLSEDQKKIYCSGIDPVIQMFEKIDKINTAEPWTQTIKCSMHTHDVNAVTILDNGTVCSGGADSNLMFSKYPLLNSEKYPPLLQSPSVCLSPQKRCILFVYPTHIEIWHLNEPSGLGMYDSTEFPTKLLHFESPNREIICNADMSSDSQWFSYVTRNTVRLFHFKFDGQQVQLEPVALKVENFLNYSGNVHSVRFSKSNDLFILDSEGNIYKLKPSIDPEIEFSISNSVTKKYHKKGITSIAVSNCGANIVTSDSNGAVILWQNNEYYSSLPKYEYNATAIKFHPNEPVLYVVYSDYKFVEYSIERKRYTKFCRAFNSELLEKYLTPFPVSNISFDYDKNNVIILNTSSTVCVFDKEQVYKKKSNKKMKLNSSTENDGHPPISPELKRKTSSKNNSRNKRVEHDVEKDFAEDAGFHVYKKYQHLVHFESLSSKEVVAVEIKPQTFFEKLPALLKQKRFGRK